MYEGLNLLTHLYLKGFFEGANGDSGLQETLVV
jgi:hypothetical protein